MTGSIYERCVGGWSYDYSTFTTTNGDGNITSEAYANVTGWPINISNRDIYEGYFARRGASCSRTEGMALSNRQWGQVNDGNRDYGIGGRGVRTF
jgi:hypothetical protein